MRKQTLSQDQIRILEQQLVIPSAIGDILEYNLKVEEEMQYGLHMALSEIDPDAALLAIALGLRGIAEKCLEEMPMASPLFYESSNILRDYAPTWLRYKKDIPMPTEKYKEMLETIPEDLEALADIADALGAEMKDLNDPYYLGCFTLISVFSIQARAHMEIANFILQEIEKDRPIEDIIAPKDEDVEPSIEAGNNIILFPVERC